MYLSRNFGLLFFVFQRPARVIRWVIAFDYMDLSIFQQDSDRKEWHFCYGVSVHPLEDKPHIRIEREMLVLS